MYAKKSLGQHFLRSERALSAIVDAGDVKADDLVLEIGPGQGALTERLLKLAGKVIAIEKDDLLYTFLQDKFSQEIAEGKFDLIHGDALAFDPATLESYKNLEYKLIANIPYNITGAILRKFLSAKVQPERMVVLVQKEVAERAVARGGKESLLSLSIKAYGTPRIVDTVKAGSFVPAPKVDSAVLAIENISRDFFKTISEETFFGAVHAGFSSKRKKLSSNLDMVFDKHEVEKIFRELNLDENLRAEDATLSVWKQILEKAVQ